MVSIPAPLLEVIRTVLPGIGFLNWSVTTTVIVHLAVLSAETDLERKSQEELGENGAAVIVNVAGVKPSTGWAFES